MEVGWPYNFSVDPPSPYNGLFGHSSGRLLAAGTPYVLDTESLAFSTGVPNNYIKRAGFSLYAGGLKNWDIIAYHDNTELERYSVSASDSVVFAGIESNGGITNITIRATGPLNNGYNVWATFLDDVYFDIAGCEVTPLPPGEPAQHAYPEGLDATFKAKLDRLQQLVGTIHFTPTSGYRSRELQAHLFAIASTFTALKGIGMVDGQGTIGGFPQLKLPDNPSADLLACEAVMMDTNSEVSDHKLTNPVPRIGVGRTSLHESGLAADITITGLSDDNIRSLAYSVGLWRPLWDGPIRIPREEHHFQPCDSACESQVPRLMPIITGESPINLFVEDPQGRRIGFDQLTGQEVNDFGESAFYSGAGSEPQVIILPPSQVLDGDYRITGVGTASGPYTVRKQLTSFDDPPVVLVDTVLANGVATSGQSLPPVTTQLVFLPGDGSGDGLVTRADVVLFLTELGRASSSPIPSDFDADGIVTLRDLALLQPHLTQPDAQAMLVPEPSAAWLALFVIAAAALWRSNHLQP